VQIHGSGFAALVKRPLGQEPSKIFTIGTGLLQEALSSMHWLLYVWKSLPQTGLKFLGHPFGHGGLVFFGFFVDSVVVVVTSVVVVAESAVVVVMSDGVVSLSVADVLISVGIVSTSGGVTVSAVATVPDSVVDMSVVIESHSPW